VDLEEIKKSLMEYRKKIRGSNNVIELESLKDKLNKLIEEVNPIDQSLAEEIEDLLIELIVQINILKKEQSCGLHWINPLSL